jgi:hypothetical protein
MENVTLKILFKKRKNNKNINGKMSETVECACEGQTKII